MPKHWGETYTCHEVSGGLAWPPEIEDSATPPNVSRWTNPLLQTSPVDSRDALVQPQQHTQNEVVGHAEGIRVLPEGVEDVSENDCRRNPALEVGNARGARLIVASSWGSAAALRFARLRNVSGRSRSAATREPMEKVTLMAGSSQSQPRSRARR